jgi:toluene monooxygenase system ferredoxin subunit
MAWTDVCGADEVPENTLKQFRVNGIALIIANYSGSFRAIPPICPHMEEPLCDSGVIAIASSPAPSIYGLGTSGRSI